MTRVPRHVPTTRVGLDHFRPFGGVHSPGFPFHSPDLRLWLKSFIESLLERVEVVLSFVIKVPAYAGYYGHGLPQVQSNGMDFEFGLI